VTTAGGIRILAVDDEPRALADLARLLRELPEVSAVECAADGEAALRRSADAAFDAVFLDVRMSGLDGLELARVLRRFSSPPELVFVSANDDAAVEAFELRAIDYLRKPVARRRAAEAVSRVRAARTAAGEAAPSGGPGGGGGGGGGRGGGGGGGGGRGRGRGRGEGDDVVAVSGLRSGTTRLLARRDVRYASSHGDYVRIVTADGRYLLRATLAEIERRWAPHGFVRVHRQYVVNLHQAVELRPQLGGTAELAFADATTIPVARRHAAELARHLSV
jgi:DNA-binding LytR/AlgR family response regulator